MKTTDIKKITKVFVLFVCLLAFGFSADTAFAQTTDGKIRIKVQTNENGNTKTFEKTYDSQDEMQNDPEYQEFFGDQPTRFFRFKGGSGDYSFDTDFSWIDSLKSSFGDQNASTHSFFFGNDGDSADYSYQVDSVLKNGRIKFFFDQDDAQGTTFNFDFSESMEELKKQMENLSNSSDFDVFFFDGNEGGNSEDQEEIVMRLKDLSDSFKDLNTGKNNIVIIRKRVVIKDLEDSDKELNKLSNKKGKELVMEDFNYYPNPSDGRFTLQFSVDEETPLSIRIFSISGKEIYRDSYESFSGTFKSKIDMSGHEKGIYLLEIAQGKKVMNKKLLID
ncbi:MAG: T9SS type A sorting domain-containing protein [Cyclobacteriaceae bacterium]